MKQIYVGIILTSCLLGNAHSMVWVSGDDLYGVVRCVIKAIRNGQKLKEKVGQEKRAASIQVTKENACAEEVKAYQRVEGKSSAAELSQCIAKLMKEKNVCINEMKAVRGACELKENANNALNSAATRLQTCFEKNEVRLPASFIAGNAEYW